MSDKKVTEEQLATLQQFQKDFDALVVQYGELHLQKRICESDIQRTEDAFNELEQERRKFATLLQEQFGSVGTVNIATGEFVAE